MAGQIIDDKSEHCIPFLVERLNIHRKNNDTPFFLGLNGVQGAGKTTLVSSCISQSLILTNGTHSALVPFYTTISFHPVLTQGFK